MKNRLLRHPGLKVASLVLAFFIWLIVVNVSNPVQTRTITGVKVNVSNASYVESRGLSYRIENGFDTIAVTVRGNRSTVERLTADRITATANLTQIIDFESDPVMVPLYVTVPNIPAENVTAVPRNIEVVIEETVTREFVIAPTAGSTKPLNGYEVGDLTCSPEKLTIRGPVSVIDKLDRVSAAVDVTNLSRDTDLAPTLSIYDKNGEVLSDTEMSYLSMSVNETDVTVHVDLFQVHAGVTLAGETSGEPADGYQVGRVTITPATISVVGNQDALDLLAEQNDTITIDAASGALDVTGAEGDIDINVDIREFLPSGIALAEDVSYTAVVTVQILPYDSKSISYSTRKIRVTGLARNLNNVFSSDRVEIRVRGTDEALEDLDESKITVTANLAGYGEGQVNIPLAVSLPEECELVEDVFAAATITATETPGERTENTDQAENTQTTINTEG